MSEPVRTCVACGRKAPQRTLLRFAASEGTLVSDVSGRRPGRGAYTCRSSACFAQARSRGAFARRLRVPVRIPDELNELFREG